MKLCWPIAEASYTPTLPAPWWVAVGYAQAYSQGVHTGVDLNLPNYGDSGKPIRAMADGVVVFSGQGGAIGWSSAREIVIVSHQALGIWSRYAHLRDTYGLAPIGATVRAGQHIGNIGDYGTPGPPDDHLHFDVTYLNLTKFPGDWPGFAADAYTRVISGYIDPIRLFRITNS